MQSVLLIILFSFIVTMVFMVVADRRMKKRKSQESMNRDVWDLERDIDGCFDYITALNINDKINRFYRRWSGNKNVSEKRLNSEYTKLHERKSRVEEKYFNRLIGKSREEEE